MIKSTNVSFFCCCWCWTRMWRFQRDETTRMRYNIDKQLISLSQWSTHHNTSIQVQMKTTLKNPFTPSCIILCTVKTNPMWVYLGILPKMLFCWHVNFDMKRDYPFYEHNWKTVLAHLSASTGYKCSLTGYQISFYPFSNINSLHLKLLCYNSDVEEHLGSWQVENVWKGYHWWSEFEKIGLC